MFSRSKTQLKTNGCVTGIYYETDNESPGILEVCIREAQTMYVVSCGTPCTYDSCNKQWEMIVKQSQGRSNDGQRPPCMCPLHHTVPHTNAVLQYITLLPSLTPSLAVLYYLYFGWYTILVVVIYKFQLKLFFTYFCRDNKIYAWTYSRNEKSGLLNEHFPRDLSPKLYFSTVSKK